MMIQRVDQEHADIYLPEPAKVTKVKPETRLEMFLEFQMASGRERSQRQKRRQGLVSLYQKRCPLVSWGGMAMPCGSTRSGVAVCAPTP